MKALSYEEKLRGRIWLIELKITQKKQGLLDCYVLSELEEELKFAELALATYLD